MQSQRLGSSLFQSLEAVGRWPIKGPGTRTLLFRKPRSQRETGSAAGKKDMVRRGPGKGLLRWAASPQLGSPSLRHSYRGIQTLWLAQLPHQCPLAALSLFTHRSATKLCAFLDFTSGSLPLYVLSAWGLFGQLPLSFRPQLTAHHCRMTSGEQPVQSCCCHTFVHLPSHPRFYYLSPRRSHVQMVPTLLLPIGLWAAQEGDLVVLFSIMSHHLARHWLPE